MGKIVFSNGTLDCLHYGHFNLLSYCRKLAGYDKCSYVIVGLDSDEKVRKDKGKNRPIFSFSERREAILKLRSDRSHLVDKCVIFNTNEQLYQLIKELRPNIIVKGADWEGNVIGSDLCEVKYFLYESAISSSKIIERVLDKYK